MVQRNLLMARLGSGLHTGVQHNSDRRLWSDYVQPHQLPEHTVGASLTATNRRIKSSEI